MMSNEPTNHTSSLATAFARSGSNAQAPRRPCISSTCFCFLARSMLIFSLAFSAAAASGFFFLNSAAVRPCMSSVSRQNARMTTSYPLLFWLHSAAANHTLCVLETHLGLLLLGRSRAQVVLSGCVGAEFGVVRGVRQTVCLKAKCTPATAEGKTRHRECTCL